MRYILMYRISQGALPTQLYDTMTTVSPVPALPVKLISKTYWLSLVCRSRSTAPHSLQCWTGNTESFFLQNYTSLITLYLCLNNCNGPLPMATLQAISTEPTESLQDFHLVLAGVNKSLMSSPQLWYPFLPCTLAARIV